MESRNLARHGILALKLAATPPPGLLATYTRIFQSLAFLERLVASPQEIDFSRLSRLLPLPLRFPSQLAALRTPRADAASAVSPPPARADSATAARLVRLDRAILELASRPNPFTRAAPTGARGVNILAPAARERISPATRATLSAEAINLASSDFIAALDTLEGARLATLSELAVREEAGDERARVALGSLLMPAAGNALMIPTGTDVLDPSTRPPTTVGPLEPSSVGQLLIACQQIKRYEAGEISHVENVLRSESRSRSTRRLTRTDESFLAEQENTDEEERDLQTTERLEMQSEIEKTIADSRAFEVGGSISAGYGPFIQVEANTNYQTESSTEQSDSKASKLAQEMTERAAKKVSQRILTRQTRTTLEEFEENNSHGFDNTNSAGNVTGIYQWLDRIYELQVYDVGVRMIFEFTLPEPAALYLRALESQVVKSEGLRRPPPLTVRPTDINANNFDLLAARYHAEGIVPPPPHRITVGHAFAHASPEGRPTGFAANDVVKIKPGYRAVLARAEIKINEPFDPVLPPDFGPEGDEPLSLPNNNRVDVLVADMRLTRAQVAGDDDIVDQEDALDDLDGELPIAVTAINVMSFAATVSIVCLRRIEAYLDWQFRTHEALSAAYRARLTEYKNERATLATQQTGAPGLEAAMLHYLETGHIWTGGELPEVTRDDYIAFLDEVDARRPEPPDPNQPLGGTPSEEIPIGLPWEIRLPTTLVALRPDGSLPRWVKDEAGAWVPVELLPPTP